MGNNATTTMAQDNSPGSLNIYIGPMYAGKTSKLIEIYEECLSNDEHVTVLTHSAEIRYSIDKLSTHDQKKISCFKYNNMKTFVDIQKESIKTTDVILIDESQFFGDLYEQVLPLVNVLHKRVYIFGLDGDFQRNKFGQILDLIPHCDTVHKLQSICAGCGEPAIFSHRTNNSSEQILVGSDTIYQPLCRSCYNSNSNSNSESKHK